MVCSSEVGIEEALKKVHNRMIESGERNLVKDAAYLLRKVILTNKTTPLPEAVTTAAVKKG